MKNFLGGRIRENLVSSLVAVTAFLLLIVNAAVDPRVDTGWDWLSAILLIIVVVVVDHYPIHIRYATKVTLVSAPLFFMAVFLPVNIAGIAAAIGLALANGLAHKERGLLPLDYLLDSGRWALIIGVMAWVNQLASGSTSDHILVFAVAAVGMYFMDILTFSAFTSLSIGEPFLSLLHDAFQQGIAIEGIQYLVGFLGAISYISAPWSLVGFVVLLLLVYRAFKNMKEVRQETHEILAGLADAVDLRDHYTGNHSRRVAFIVHQIVHAMQITGAEAELIETAARLHDIGKIGIRDEVLNKPGRLSEAEWQVMRSHVEKGAELLARYTDFSRGVEMVLYHHERWDGTGYTHQMKGHDIPFGARVISVADAFDAMTSYRLYRPAMTIDQARQELQMGRGIQWDPNITDVLLAILEDAAAVEALAAYPNAALPLLNQEGGHLLYS